MRVWLHGWSIESGLALLTHGRGVMVSTMKIIVIRRQRKSLRLRTLRRRTVVGIFRESQKWLVLISIPGPRPRMPLDHPLRGEERLDLFSQVDNIAALLKKEGQGSELYLGSTAYPEPVGAFCTKAKALKPQAFACSTMTLFIGVLITLLSPRHTSKVSDTVRALGRRS